MASEGEWNEQRGLAPTRSPALVSVVLVLRSGGAYQPAHVAAVANALRTACDVPVEIVALSDLPLAIAGVRHIPLRHAWPGWWSKMEAFRADISTGLRVLCDLDTLISPGLDPLFTPGFATLEDYFHKGRVSTALMRWQGRDLTFVYDRFRTNPAHWMARGSCGAVPNAVHGDQVVVDHLLRREGITPVFLQDQHPHLVNFYNADMGVVAPVTIFIGNVKPVLGPDGALHPPPRSNEPARGTLP